MVMGCDGASASGSCRAGSSRPGRPGGRSSRRHSGRCPRRSPPTAGSGHSPRPTMSIASPADVGAFLDAVGAELPDVRLLTDPGDREAYRLDETAYLTAGLPAAVALPASTADVSGLLRLASAHRVPVVPRGAGTGLSGGAAGIEGAVTIAL